MRDGYCQESDLDSQVIECSETLQGNHENPQIKAWIVNCLNSLALRPKAVPGGALFWFSVHLDKFWHMFLIKLHPRPWLQDMAGISVLWGPGACRAESAGHDGQKRCTFCVLALAHFLLALRQPSTHVCLSHPELMSQSFLPTFSSPSLLLQQLLATSAYLSFLLASGVGEVAWLWIPWDLASQEHLLTRHQDSQTGFLQALCPQEHALTPLDPLGPARLGRYSLRDAER